MHKSKSFRFYWIDNGYAYEVVIDNWGILLELVRMCKTLRFSYSVFEKWDDEIQWTKLENIS